MPIEELFYHGKNKRAKKKNEITTSTTTTTISSVTSVEEEDDDYDDYGVWDDYFDVPEDDNTTISTSKKEKPKPLIKKGLLYCSKV